MTKQQKIAEAYKEQEAAIHDFSIAMRGANVAYMRDRARFTPNMTMAWDRYIVSCMILCKLTYGS